ncbi:MAG: hypothetical protein WC977_11685 [Anaerovoracaceae bacterium]
MSATPMTDLGARRFVFNAHTEGTYHSARYAHSGAGDCGTVIPKGSCCTANSEELARECRTVGQWVFARRPCERCLAMLRKRS